MFFYFCFDAAPFWGALKVIIGDYFVDVFYFYFDAREHRKCCVAFTMEFAGYCCVPIRLGHEIHRGNMSLGMSCLYTGTRHHQTVRQKQIP